MFGDFSDAWNKNMSVYTISITLVFALMAITEKKGGKISRHIETPLTFVRQTINVPRQATLNSSRARDIVLETQ